MASDLGATLTEALSAKLYVGLLGSRVINSAEFIELLPNPSFIFNFFTVDSEPRDRQTRATPGLGGFQYGYSLGVGDIGYRRKQTPILYQRGPRHAHTSDLQDH